MSGHDEITFGSWLRRRRKTRDLTQKKLAESVECAEITVRKIEANQLRPSKQLARRLLESLEVPRKEQNGLIELSRQRANGS
jgi:transcriptional regulator with XRE-family HTH domain